MAIQCSSCKKITFDIDSPPCGERDCSRFKPVNVLITHFSYKNKIVCSGEDYNSSIRSYHLLPYVNCPECLVKGNELLKQLRQEELEKKNPKPKVQPQETPVIDEVVYLADKGLSAKIVETLFQHGVQIGDMSILTLEGFKSWVKHNNISSIPGIDEEDEFQLLAILEG